MVPRLTPMRLPLALPDGLTLNTSTGELSGTPTADGTSNFTITATDANSATGTQAYSLVIGVQPVTANAVTTTVAANSSANAITLNLTGGTATNVAVATNASHGTATASGTGITYTPTAGYSGSDSFTYTATNAAGIHCSNGLYHRYCTNSEPDTIDSVCRDCRRRVQCNHQCQQWYRALLLCGYPWRAT
ncbi:Ig-like domain-containing protein [Plesiomonas shigelloides]|uniref:Ig-like domain-containing protein n=1 Tax=Plesiomonas shigelloides TaxID=703 RepID=UPI002E7A72EE|nr:Ig-like domain-containing protein [Plesiomonas shigelloides]